MGGEEVQALPDVRSIKSCRPGEQVSFRARVLRLWDTGGTRMALVGDESALTRVELGKAAVEPGRSYEFLGASVREYPARKAGAPAWHSASLEERGEAVPLADEVPVSQSEEYIDFTYRILAGIQRKKARRAGRIEPWRHPAKG